MFLIEYERFEGSERDFGHARVEPVQRPALRPAPLRLRAPCAQGRAALRRLYQALTAPDRRERRGEGGTAVAGGGAGARDPLHHRDCLAQARGLRHPAALLLDQRCVPVRA